MSDARRAKLSTAYAWLEQYPEEHHELLLQSGVPPASHERGHEANLGLIELAGSGLSSGAFECLRHLLMVELLGDDPRLSEASAPIA